MKKVVVSLLVLTIGLCAFCVAAEQPAKTYKGDASAQAITRVSEDGYEAMRAVRSARVAIFNGETASAMEMLNEAKENLRDAYKDVSSYFPTAKTQEKTERGTTRQTHVKWIPIDGQVALAETYVSTPKKTEHINKANHFFKNGQSKEALEELRQGEIDVTYSCVLMPWEETMQCIDKAANLAQQHKYFEANMALKAAEDGLVVDSTSLIGTPTEKTEVRHSESIW